MTSAGYGVAVLPSVFKDRLNPGLCSKRLRLPVSMPPLQLFMVWRSKNMPAPLQSFLEVARGVAAAKDGARTQKHDGANPPPTRRLFAGRDGATTPAQKRAPVDGK